jgi:hypothetical protein
MSDSILDDDCEDEEVSKKSDFVSMSGNVLSMINYKVAFFMYIIGMLIFSDLFIEGVLQTMSNDLVEGTCTTTKGTCVQLLFFIIAYILLDLSVAAGWL